MRDFFAKGLERRDFQVAELARRPCIAGLQYPMHAGEAIGGQLFERTLDRVSKHFPFGRGDLVGDERDGRFAQDAGEIAAGCPFNLAAVRIICFGRNAGQCERFGVGDGEMPAVAQDKQRMRGHGLVELGESRQPLLGGSLLVESDAENPLVRGGFQRLGACAFEQFVDRASVVQVEVHEEVCGEYRMHVAVNEARQKRLAAEVDDFAFGGKRFQLGQRPDGL